MAAGILLAHTLFSMQESKLAFHPPAPFNYEYPHHQFYVF
jgi:hypothetical protein